MQINSWQLKNYMDFKRFLDQRISNFRRANFRRYLTGSLNHLNEKKIIS